MSPCPASARSKLKSQLFFLLRAILHKRKTRFKLYPIRAAVPYAAANESNGRKSIANSKPATHQIIGHLQHWQARARGRKTVHRFGEQTLFSRSPMYVIVKFANEPCRDNSSQTSRDNLKTSCWKLASCKPCTPVQSTGLQASAAGASVPKKHRQSEQSRIPQD